MRFLTLTGLLLCSVTAFGQAGMEGGFSTMDVKADHAVGNFMTGRFDSLTGEVRLVLGSGDANTPTTTIEADRMDFSYAAEDGATPERIVLTGHVFIPNPDPNVKSVRSQNAVWSFVTGVITFKDQVRLEMGSGETMHCREARVNLSTGDL